MLTPKDAENSDPRLELQWSFKCALTKGRNVSSMAWNPVKSDLLAVSYGYEWLNGLCESCCLYLLCGYLLVRDGLLRGPIGQ